MPFESTRKRTCHSRLEAARTAKQEHKEQERNGEIAVGEDRIGDDDRVADFEVDETFEVRETSDKSQDADGLSAKLEEVTAENVIYSQEIYSLRERIISISQENGHLKGRVTSIQLTITKVSTTRGDYRIKYSRLVKKMQRLPKPTAAQTARGSQMNPPNGRRMYSYSELENWSERSKRQKEALEALQLVAKEEDVHELLDDVMGLCDQSDEQSFNYKLSIWQGVILKSKCLLSRSQLETMKQLLKQFTGRDFLPSVKKICDVAREQSRIDLFEESVVLDPDGKVINLVMCTDVLELMKWRLESVAPQLLFDEYSGDSIVIGLGGDAGGGNTKLCLLFGNLPHPNSIHNVITVAVFDGPDTYDAISNYVPSLVEQLNALESISYNENGKVVRRNIILKVVGDFKFVCEVLTHKKQCARFFCPYCEAQNQRGPSKPRLKDQRVNSHFSPRTIRSYLHYAKNGSKGVYAGKGPLFPNVNILDHIVGMLHLVMGVFKRYIFNPLWVHCVTIDNTTSFDIVMDKSRTLELADQKLSKLRESFTKCSVVSRKSKIREKLEKLQEEKVKLDEIVDGVEGGKLKALENCWESIGVSRRAYFQTLNGNHTKKLLTDTAIVKTFEVFDGSMNHQLYALKRAMEKLSKFWSLCSNRILTTAELRELNKYAWEFLADLVDGFPDDGITQKLHVLLFHVMELSMRQRSMGRLTEQGIEAKHSQFKTLERRFCCYRNKSSRWMLILREMLCATLSTDSTKDP